MKYNARKKIMSITLISATLIACGGGGGDDTGTITPPSAPQIISRHITGGIQQVDGQRILVGDQWIDVARARISYASHDWSEPLQAGMDVQLTVTDNQATLVTLNPLLTGQLASSVTKDRSQNNWQVNNVKLDLVDANAQVGDWVMIFGEYTPQGSVSVKKLAGLTGDLQLMEIENRVVDLNESNKVFKLGQVEVNYQNAIIEDGVLHEGVWVEAYGPLRGKQMQASSIEVEDSDDLLEGSDVEGVVNYFDAKNGLLELNRQRQMWVTNITRFENGTSLDLKSGAVVDVEVTPSARGTIAKEIKFEGITDSSGIGQQFKLSGIASWNGSELVINGIKLKIDGLTIFDDNIDRNNIDGRWIEADGIVSNGLNLVREIDHDMMDHSIELIGPVTQASLWNYTASDNSLSIYEGKWVDVECYFDGNYLSNCHLDD